MDKQPSPPLLPVFINPVKSAHFSRSVAAPPIVDLYLNMDLYSKYLCQAERSSSSNQQLSAVSPSSAGRCCPESWTTSVCSGRPHRAPAPRSLRPASRVSLLQSTRSWPAACSHWRTVSSRPWSEGRWPPGPGSPACSPSGRPGAVWRPDRWRSPGRGGSRRPWGPILWKIMNINVLFCLHISKPRDSVRFYREELKSLFRQVV